MSYYDEIKYKLINNEIYKKVKDYSKNRNELQTYYDVGKLLIEAQGGEERAKYGDGLIREYLQRLTSELGKGYTTELGKGYTTTNLKNMRKFYLIFSKSHAMRDQLTWTHYRELLVLNNFEQINYYIKICIEQNLPYRKLREKIRSGEYERLGKQLNNKITDDSIGNLIKNPIIIKNKDGSDHLSEYALKNLIMENIDDFLTELGDGFCYIKNEYRIKLGDRYNYIDLLLFNIDFNCYVVVELKVTELKKEHIGQIETYMNYIDRNVKKINHNKTVGIIIVRKDNKFVMEYCSNRNIFRTTYELV